MQNYEYFFAGGVNSSYLFKTDFGISYEIKFKDSSYLFAENNLIPIQAFELGIEVFDNPTNIKPPLDPRIPITIANIVRDFFLDNHEQALIYICDSSDNKQAARNRKFNRWVEYFDSDFINLNSTIVDYQGVIYYTSLILHIGNPKRQYITDAYLTLTSKYRKDSQ